MLNNELKQQISQDSTLKLLVKKIRAHFLERGFDEEKAQKTTLLILENNQVILQDYLQNKKICQPTIESVCHQIQPGFETTINYENGRFYLGLKHCAHWEQNNKTEKLQKQFLYCDYDVATFSQTTNDYWEELESDQDIFSQSEIDQRKIFLGKVFDKIRNHDNKGFYLYGEPGVGKTIILQVIANTIATNGDQSVAFVNFAKFVDQQKLSIIEKNNQRHRDVLYRLKTADILFLDDLGAESVSAWSRDDLLLSLLNARMENKKLTFFSSNFSMKQLKENYLLRKEQYPIEKVKQKRFLERIRVLAEEYYLEGNSHRV
ncbi:primosomal protein DnaI [Entomoplasma freundtii]|uniref:Primosomal protein DnaI n=1 Tax=Entomoplasma freundtii TaxID=74700 RepID=A0A2K8NRH3_9MOLU|nr:AFG1/ZapE family ATPase [Entomoplasma freundtii]ATZ16455.1 primosomal protein DnaI [Entomoplasma freundtii]TDY55985.1 primosomal protein DnaI [Entomoplasma freundtii]